LLASALRGIAGQEWPRNTPAEFMDGRHGLDDGLTLNDWVRRVA
jgi:hypothetical protein